jgi:hypothetical protein
VAVAAPVYVPVVLACALAGGRDLPALPAMSGAGSGGAAMLGHP